MSAPFSSIVGQTVFCICTSIAFLSTESSAFATNPNFLPHIKSNQSTESNKLQNASTSKMYAFPDSRSHHSNDKSRRGPSSANKKSQERKYKRTEDEDEKPSVLADQPSPMNAVPKERKFRSSPSSPSASSSSNANANASGYANRKRKRYTRNNYNHFNPQSIFTKQLTAPPLEKLEIPKAQDRHDDDYSDMENFIVSPSVIQNNHQECMTYICGELPVTYTNDPDTLEQWLMEHCSTNQLDSYHSVLGFDVEAAPNVPWRKPINSDFIDRPATVQLSTPYSSIVVHLTKRPRNAGRNSRSRSILSPLVALLSDETILKVGAGIDEDMLELYRWNQALDAKSRFDIGGIGSDSKRQRVGLQKLVRAIVGVELPKSKKIATSDWSQIPLSNKQLCYASRDAWAGAAVMENIGKMYDDLQVDSIAALVREKERSMADVDSRARTRKETKIKMKDIMSEVKDMSTFLQPKTGKTSGKQHHERLLQIMPRATKLEMKRLQKIMDETSPDGVIFFDADDLGLDFNFVTEQQQQQQQQKPKQ